MARLGFFFAVLLLVLRATGAHGGIAEYTDRGKIDFDKAIDVLKPYGKWSKIDDRWAFTPNDHQTPYTHGRWLYTEYGWNWQGTEPISWVTEHYGFWKRGDDKVWSWYPGPDWLPQIVEIRVTDTGVGWRCGEVDENGSFVEEPEDRFAKTDEWTWVTREQFTRPITPAVIADADETSKQMDDSRDSLHTYVTYRAITRPGPHPADFLKYPNTGMFAASFRGEFVPAAPAVVTMPAPAGTNAAPKTAVIPTANDDAGGPPADPRQVHYWTTMSLPEWNTPRPADGKPDEIYVYRPEFYQDQDGIERRIALFIDPNSRTTLDQLLGADGTGSGTAGGGKKKASSLMPEENAPSPAVPVSSGPFRSPFDESFHGGAGPVSPRTSPVSSKGAAPSGIAPSGLNSDATNSPPPANP